MSLQGSLEKLQSPLKDLVSGAIQGESYTNSDNSEVIEWIDKVVQGDIVDPSNLRVRFIEFAS